MATGRLCPKCLQDIVLVCTCRTTLLRAAAVAIKRPRDETADISTKSPPPQPLNAAAPRGLNGAAEQTPLNGVNRPPSFVGTSTVVEKSYVRPSSAPVMSAVRPVDILQQAFHRCLQKEYSELSFVSDQLKSIRQDLTVQAIESNFTATVYEFHARVCLLLRHLPEFGQCLNHVRVLHAKGFHGSREAVSATLLAVNPPTGRLACPSETEFSAFRLAYTGLAAHFDDELANEVMFLERRRREGETEFDWSHPLIAYALRAVKCRYNAPLYTALLHRAPTPTLRALLDMFRPKLRVDWLKTLIHAVDEFVPAGRLATMLGFDSEAAVQQLFEPIVGLSWKSGGFVVRDCRHKVAAYVAEVTQRKM